MVKTIDKLTEITSKLEYLENSAEWIARETVHLDNTLSQSGTMICVLADDIREKVFALVQDLEQRIAEIDSAITYN